MRNFFFALLVANILLFVWAGESPVPGHGGRLVLKTNSPSLEAVAPLSGDQRRQIETSRLENAERCFVLGPYDGRADAQRDLDAVRARQWTASLRESSHRFKVGDWIYLPPYDSLSEASEVVRQLKARGLRDVYVVAASRWENAVALGLYSNPAGVRRRLAELHDLGLRPEVEPRFRERPAYRLIVAADRLSLDVLSEVIHSDVDVRPGDCDDLGA